MDSFPLPRIQSSKTFLLGYSSHSVQHPPVADFFVLAVADLTLDLKPGFGQVNRERAWQTIYPLQTALHTERLCHHIIQNKDNCIMLVTLRPFFLQLTTFSRNRG